MKHNDSISHLSHSWFSLTRPYSGKSALINDFFLEIQEAYSSPGRHYHNLEHIDALLCMSGKYQSYLKEKEIVDFAIFYHDICYDVFRSDNEERSAGIAKQRLNEIGLPDEKVLTVAKYIIASKSHQLSEAENKTDLAWFLDFDMSVLRSEWEIYYQYATRIRQEYIGYPAQVYKAGRGEFLRRTLLMPFIFHTSEFRQNFEHRARLNIKKELEMLNQI